MKNNPVRKGSIPMVLIVVVCLGIVAGAAIFSTGNTARLDKKSELNQAAWVVAQSAVEEIIVRAANSGVALEQDKRKYYHAETTKALVDPNGQTAQIDPVHVVYRSVDDRSGGTPTARKHMFELAALVPGFYKNDNPGAANLLPEMAKTSAGAPITPVGQGVDMFYDIGWRKTVAALAAANKLDPEIAKMVVNAVENTKDQQIIPAATFDENALEGTAGDNESPRSYYEQAIKTGGKAESDNAGNANPNHTPVLATFKAIPTLSPLNPTGAAGFDWATAKHTDGELQQFKVAYDAAMSATATHMQARINGCNGDFNYAIGGMLTALSRGTPAENDSEPGEETYRDTSNDSGLTQYREGMLSVATKVKFNAGTMTGEQSFSAHRLVRQMNLNVVMSTVGNNMYAYLHAYYNLTRADLANPVLGFAALRGAADPATSPILSYKPQLYTTMDQRYSVGTGNAQVRNAQLATCLSGIK